MALQTSRKSVGVVLILSFIMYSSYICPNLCYHNNNDTLDSFIVQRFFLCNSEKTHLLVVLSINIKWSYFEGNDF